MLSLCCAPFVSILLMNLLAATYSEAGIVSSWTTVLLPLIALGVILLGIRRAMRKIAASDAREMGKRLLHPQSLRSFAMLAAYVVVGVAVTSAVFLGSLNDPNGFVQEFDNIHHLGVTRGFLESGDWSSLHVVLYPTAADQLINPLPDPAYYPSAWNVLAALAAQLSGADVPAAVNATNFAVCAVVFPVSMWGFMRTVFRHRDSVVCFGALTCLAFTMFPWSMLVFGPLYPNILAFALLPVMMAVFIRLFDPHLTVRSRLGLAGLFVVAVASCAFTQPNAVFSAAALLAPFLVWKTADLAGAAARARFGSNAKVASVRLTAGLVAAASVVVVWVALFNLPFLEGVVDYNWPAFRSLDEAFADVVTGSFRMDVPQCALMALVLVGAVATLYKRRYLWMTVSFVLVAAIYVVDVVSDGVTKQLLSGFWYTDSLRVAAFAAIIAVPLASLGAWVVAVGLSRLIALVPRLVGFHARRAANGAAAVLVAIAFAFAVYDVPSLMPLVATNGAASSQLNDSNAQQGGSAQWASESAFANMVATLAKMNNPFADDMYDPDERAFMEQVKELVPEGSLIINVPDDGSTFAYSVNDMNMYYRYLRTYGVDYETADSFFIRNGLANITYSPGVLEAVRHVGAHYVVLLDQGGDAYSQRQRRYLFTYENGKNWQGILSITDNTPGFEVVLAEGDMRLYRITAAD